MKTTNSYKAMKTDLGKLGSRIAKRQQSCQQAASKNDLEMAQMYEKDVKDLTDILNAINNSDYKMAWDIIVWLDTAVREELPARLYNFLAKENGYN